MMCHMDMKIYFAGGKMSVTIFFSENIKLKMTNVVQILEGTE